MADKGGIPTKLFVGNLPVGCARQSLYDLFAQCGKVVECDIIKDYAFVHFSNPIEAKRAVTELDQYKFQGVNIKVELSHSRVRPKPGMGVRDKCFRCGEEGHWSKECPLEGGAGQGGGRGGGPMFNERRFVGRGGGDGGYMSCGMGGGGPVIDTGYGSGGGGGGYYSMSMAASAAAPPMAPSRFHPYSMGDRRSVAVSVPPVSYPAMGRSMTDEFGRPTPEYYAMRSTARRSYDMGPYAGRVPLAAASTMYPLAAMRRSPPRY